MHIIYEVAAVPAHSVYNVGVLVTIYVNILNSRLPGRSTNSRYPYLQMKVSSLHAPLHIRETEAREGLKPSFGGTVAAGTVSVLRLGVDRCRQICRGTPASHSGMLPWRHHIRGTLRRRLLLALCRDVPKRNSRVSLRWKWGRYLGPLSPRILLESSAKAATDCSII